VRISFGFAVASCSLLSLLLSGCSGVPVPTSAKTASVHGAAIQGKVYGGQTVISGASLYLYAANNTGYGNASISLLNSNVLDQTPAGGQDINGNYYVTTGSDGSFGITGDYTCPSTTSQLYLYAVGGNPGLGEGTNSAIGLLAALGTCQASSTLSPALYIVINEVSTIATAYSIAGYATDALDVSSPSTTLAQTGIANAFATVTNLETLNTGLALATTPAANGGNGTVPQTEINTLANILAACINSSGPSSSTCAALFSNAMNGSTAPTDTAAAAINIAHNPGANIAALYGLQTGSTPFQPDLSVAPNDFTIAVGYTGGGLNSPEDIAIDASGNVWVTNYGNSSISELSPIGAALSPSQGDTGGGLYIPLGIAIDAAGNVWATNSEPNSAITELNSSGIAISGSTGDTGDGLNEPYFLAFDASGNLWISNENPPDSLSELNSSGMAITGSKSPFTGGGLNIPGSIAIDVAGNVWAANDGYNSISELNSSGSPVSGSLGYAGGGIDSPQGIAVDAAGNVWAANINNSSISEFIPSGSGGSWNSKSPFTGGGLSGPSGIAIDGSGYIWVTSGGNNGISEFSSTGSAISGSNGYQGGGLYGPDYNAVDGSGNLWVTSSLNNTIVEFIGVASPVVTPIVANLRAPYGASAVNKP
jgi:streptogramin lyase